MAWYPGSVSYWETLCLCFNLSGPHDSLFIVVVRCGKTDKKFLWCWILVLSLDSLWNNNRPYCLRTIVMAPMVKNPPEMQEIQVQSLGHEEPLEKGMATNSSIPAWRIPWFEEPGGLQTNSRCHKESDTTEQLTLVRFSLTWNSNYLTWFIFFSCFSKWGYSKENGAQNDLNFLFLPLLL